MGLDAAHAEGALGEVAEDHVLVRVRVGGRGRARVRARANPNPNPNLAEG